MLRKILEFLGMLAGAFGLAMAVNLFYKPMAIFAGGIPGISIILLNLLGESFNDYLGIIILCVAVVFFMIQFAYMRREKLIKSTLTLTTFISLVQLTTPWTKTILISENILLMAIGGSILAGLGVGFIILNGYSFIGTLGIADILSGKLGIPPGRTVLMVESIVISSGSLVVGVEQAMISAIALYMFSKTIHSITFGMYQHKKLLIVSPKMDEIRTHLTKEVCAESSILMANNAINNLPQNLLMIIIRYDQFKLARDIIRQYDPHAFVIASDVTEMIGEGFRTL